MIINNLGNDLETILKQSEIENHLLPLVVLTREAGKNDKLKAKLEPLSIPTLELPCIAHEKGKDYPNLVNELRTKIPSYDYIIITSPESASVFLKALESAKNFSPEDQKEKNNSNGKENVTFIDIERLNQRLVTIGKATEDILQKKIGLYSVFSPSKALGSVLGDELPFQNNNIKRDHQTSKTESCHVLYPTSAKALGTIEKKLKARNFNVKRLNTYNTIPATWDSNLQLQAMEKGNIIAIGSPSALNVWTSRCDTSNDSYLSEYILACIGETSARAAAKAGYQYIYYPSSPGIVGWSEAIQIAILNSSTAMQKKKQVPNEGLERMVKEGEIETKKEIELFQIDHIESPGKIKVSVVNVQQFLEQEPGKKAKDQNKS